MQRIGFAVLAVLMAAVLVSAAAYGAGAFMHFAGHALRHIQPGVAIAFSMTISMGAMYFCVWIGMRHGTRRSDAKKSSR